MTYLHISGMIEQVREQEEDPHFVRKVIALAITTGRITEGQFDELADALREAAGE